MRFAILNDTHAGARNSSDIFIDYQSEFYDKIFFPYCVKNGITNLIHLGDYFEHRKFVNFKALAANKAHFLDKLKLHGIKMYIIAGNHDVFYKNDNALNSIDELIGYHESVHHIRTPQVLQFDDVKVGLIPWINQNNRQETIDFIMSTDASVIGGHFEIMGFEMYKGVVNREGMDTSPLERFDLVVSGHYHTKSNKGNIHYLGSQMEFTWSDSEDPKFFHVYDTDEKKLIPVRNPITLFSKIYYNDENSVVPKVIGMGYENKYIKVIVENKTNIHLFDQFMLNLQSVLPADIKVAESFQEFSGENVSDDNINLEKTETLLDTYIEGIETNLDHNELKRLTRGIYIEAMELDII